MSRKQHKEPMRAELSASVQSILNRYRVHSHREWNKAIDDVCNELKGLKKGARKHRTLLTRSEHLECIERNHRPSLASFFTTRRNKYVWKPE